MSTTADLLSSLSSTTTTTNALLSSSTSSTSTSSTSSLSYNFTEFLTLFTTQLKNQDPTKPMDTTEMTNQLALFSNVEETAGVNSRLDKLLAAQTAGSLNSAISYIGKTVQSSGDQVSLSGGTATIAYSLPSAATTMSVSVTDSSGNLVTTLTGDTASGSHKLTWDGTDSSGTTVSDGAYTVAVTAKDSSGTALTATTYTTGKVTGVETSDSETLLDLGSIQVKASAVVAVAS